MKTLIKSINRSPLRCGFLHWQLRSPGLRFRRPSKQQLAQTTVTTVLGKQHWDLTRCKITPESIIRPWVTLRFRAILTAVITWRLVVSRSGATLLGFTTWPLALTRSLATPPANKTRLLVLSP